MKQVHSNGHPGNHCSFRNFPKKQRNHDRINLQFRYSFHSPSSPERELKHSHADCCYQTREASVDKPKKKQHPTDPATARHCKSSRLEPVTQHLVGEESSSPIRVRSCSI